MNRITACMIPVLLCGVSLAEDWPQWQGPDRNGVSRESGLLQKWPDGGPPLAWKADNLGGGDSAPAIVAGRLYGLSHRDGKEIVWALSEESGREIWATSLGDATQQRMPQSKEGPGSTPTVVGDHLYVIGMGGTVACLNTQDGTVVWQRSMTEDFGGTLPAWSYRESPLVDGDRLICTPGSGEALIVALNRLTGETIWKNGTSAQATASTTTETPQRSQPSSRPGQSGSPPRVTGTQDPGLFLSEHWGMTAFRYKVPNGQYVAKLYFAETYSGIRGEGQRVFSMNVHGTQFKDFDIWKKAGGFQKAYIESVPVRITDGEFQVTFTSKVQSPAIKAIEIIPQGTTADAAKTVRIKAGQTTPFKDSKGQVWLADQGFTGGATSPGFVSFGGRGSGRRTGGGRGFGGRGGRSGAAYSSVITINFENKKQYVQLTAGALMGVSAEDGKTLWKYDAPANRMGINCSTPVYHDGLIFAASAYGNGGGAVRLIRQDDGTIKAEEAYFTRNMQNHHGGMVVVDGALFGANGGNEGGYLASIDFKTGDVLWRDRKAPKGAVLLADGRIYLRSEDGEMVLIEPSRERLIEHGRFRQPDRSSSPAWAHPVISNGRLYLRDQGLLLCYDIQS